MIVHVEEWDADYEMILRKVNPEHLTVGEDELPGSPFVRKAMHWRKRDASGALIVSEVAFDKWMAAMARAAEAASHNPDYVSDLLIGIPEEEIEDGTYYDFISRPYKERRKINDPFHGYHGAAYWQEVQEHIKQRRRKHPTE